MDSADRFKVFVFMDQTNLRHIDFFFIDGWHSVKQCIADWQNVEQLAPDGIVLLHDTNVHIPAILPCLKQSTIVFLRR